VNINLFSKNIKTNAKVKSWSDILWEKYIFHPNYLYLKILLNNWLCMFEI
jgi:hypothetical protein